MVHLSMPGCVEKFADNLLSISIGQLQNLGQLQNRETTALVQPDKSLPGDKLMNKRNYLVYRVPSKKMARVSILQIDKKGYRI